MCGMGREGRGGEGVWEGYVMDLSGLQSRLSTSHNCTHTETEVDHRKNQAGLSSLSFCLGPCFEQYGITEPGVIRDFICQQYTDTFQLSKSYFSRRVLPRKGYFRNISASINFCSVVQSRQIASNIKGRLEQFVYLLQLVLSKKGGEKSIQT